ncbi:conserved membrane protein of unknown function [Tenacibaculum soleae]|uniref:hypothetical protein n=1 Tax=Tenacibaculum soleae TaxID=447689 RepID=UPI003AB66759
MKLYKLLEKVYLNPKKLFLIDAMGALLSAFLLGVVLVKFKNLFRVPVSVLYLLTLFPVIFAVYDILCYLKAKNNLKLFLKTIAYLNILYCFVSVVILLNRYKQITFLGYSYFLVEILIILTLANFQIKVGNKLKK